MTEDEQKKYIEDLEAMFASDGWKHFKSEMEMAIQSFTNELLNGLPHDNYLKTVGRLQAFRQMVALPVIIEHTKEQAIKSALDELP